MSGPGSWRATPCASSASTGRSYHRRPMGRTVRLIGVPVDLYLRAANHQAELAREFALIAFGDKSGMTTHEVPTRLLDIVDELRHRYGRPSDDIRALFEHAAARGERTVDLELPDDDVVADLTERVTAILDDAD